MEAKDAASSPSPRAGQVKDDDINDYVDMLLQNDTDPDRPFDRKSKLHWTNLRRTVVHCPKMPAKDSASPVRSPGRSDASGSPGPMSPNGAGSPYVGRSGNFAGREVATPRLTSDGRVKLFVNVENEPMQKVLVISEEMSFETVDKKIQEKLKRTSFTYHYKDGDTEVFVHNDTSFREFKEQQSTGKLKLLARPASQAAVAAIAAQAELEQQIASPRMNRAVFTRRHRFTGHTGQVYCCSISSTGAFAVTGARDYTAMMWDTSTCRCKFIFRGHINHYILCIDIAKNDKLVVSGDADGVILVWEPLAGKIQHTIKGHSGRVYDARFSPDSSVIVSASLDKVSKVFSMKDGSCLRTLSGHTEGVISVGFSQKPGSILLATGSDDTTIRLWNWQTGNVIDTLKNGHENTVWGIAFSSDDAIMVSTALSYEALVWDMSNRTVMRRLHGHGLNAVQRACFVSPKMFITCGRDGMLVMWDIERPANDDIVGRAQGHDSIVYCIVAANNMAVSSSADGTANFWELSPEC
eukprot:TRINITY_DN8529_c0_g1_i1.p1 TRINITY_DN8529_c0_g1~~TRINITY_DN8529_c0_g1_i1.p1  ORF type:complete len:523 (+),score=96.33 TRINITY_DN8529_c0_g1_i1:51-1619(+)